MKIQIVKAKTGMYWYANKIGEVFEVDYENESFYYVKRNEMATGVHKTDAEEVIEHNSQLYRKVDRPVREGDTVLITKYSDRDIHLVTTVKEVDDEGDFYTEDEPEEDCDLVLCDDPEDVYVVLEPIEPPIQPSAPTYAEVSELLHEATSEFNEGVDELTEKYDSTLRNLSDDIVTHNGKQYRKVKRNAAVGELVVIVDNSMLTPYKIGDVLTVDAIDNDGGAMVDEYYLEEEVDNECDYLVLEPIEQNSQLDLIANLAQEVAELKRQLTHAKTDIADLEDRVDESEKDVEEVQQNVAEVIGRMNDLGDGAEAAAVVPVEVIEKVIAELSNREDRSDELCDTYEIQHHEELAQFHDGKANAFMEAIDLLEEALRNG